MRQISVAIIVCASERRLIIEKAGVYSRIIYEAEPAAAAAVDDGADDAVSSISGRRCYRQIISECCSSFNEWKNLIGDHLKATESAADRRTDGQADSSRGTVYVEWVGWWNWHGEEERIYG